MAGLKKIKDATIPCNHPEHNPPTNMVLEPGTYEYMCPSCDKIVVFDVLSVTC